MTDEKLLTRLDEHGVFTVTFNAPAVKNAIDTRDAGAPADGVARRGSRPGRARRRDCRRRQLVLHRCRRALDGRTGPRRPDRAEVGRIAALAGRRGAHRPAASPGARVRSAAPHGQADRRDVARAGRGSRVFAGARLRFSHRLAHRLARPRLRAHRHAWRLWRHVFPDQAGRAVARQGNLHAQRSDRRGDGVSSRTVQSSRRGRRSRVTDRGFHAPTRLGPADRAALREGKCRDRARWHARFHASTWRHAT